MFVRLIELKIPRAVGAGDFRILLLSELAALYQLFKQLGKRQDERSDKKISDAVSYVGDHALCDPDQHLLKAQTVQ